MKKKEMPTVAVLMSTYNGEKFLEEQIDSVLRQSDVRLNLYIRDDGSKDKTRAILQRYSDLPNIHLRFGENVGVGNSFAELLYDTTIDAEYYAFSDQDDIWLTDKLHSAICGLESFTLSGLPALYAGNMLVADQDGNEMGVRYSEPRNTDFHAIIKSNPLSGCTMVWNRSLCRIIRAEGKRASSIFFNGNYHDVWVALVASLCANIYFDMQPYILYRQHSNNVMGAVELRHPRIQKIKMQIGKIIHKELRGMRSERAREVYERYQDMIGQDKKDLYLYAYYKNEIKLRLLLMKDKKIINIPEENRLSFGIKVLLGLF